MPFAERQDAYGAEVTYGTNSEFGFDYLRDNMAVSLKHTVQRGNAYAIVDEVDSILIDEAWTPLIISGEPETAAKTYYDFARVARQLTSVASKFMPKGVAKPEDEPHDEYDEKFKTVSPRESAIETGGADARDREPLRPTQRSARQPLDPGDEGGSRTTSATSTTWSWTARSRSSTSSRAGSWRVGAGRKACTRRSRRRRA